MNDDGNLTVDALIAHPFDGTTFGGAIRRHFPLFDGRNGRDQWVEKLHREVEYCNAFPPGRRWPLDRLCVSIFRKLKADYARAEANRERELEAPSIAAHAILDKHRHQRIADWSAWRLYRDKRDCERLPFLSLCAWTAAGRPLGDTTGPDAGNLTNMVTIEPSAEMVRMCKEAPRQYIRDMPPLRQRRSKA